MLRYCSTAGALGIGWFVVLLIPGMTRQWLLASPGTSLAMLVIASILVAVICRRFIARPRTAAGQLLRAVVIPYLGCVVFLSLWAAQLWARTLLFGGLANFHDTLSLYAMGLLAAALSFFVVIPYGFLCQYLMQPLAEWMEER